MNFYNEFDPFKANWIRNLIEARHIRKGVVDERSITEVTAADLLGYGQCHFFAGICGWSEAFRLAGISEANGIWSASLPCQPISCAGKRRGQEDKRHLWPEFYRLVSECRPAIINGEQSGSKDGREWLDGISADLEELGYAVGASDLCAACVGAPHIRQRIYYGAYRMADSSGTERDWWNQSAREHWRALYITDCRKNGRMDDDIWLGNASCDNERRSIGREPCGQAGVTSGGSGSGLVDAIGQRLEGHAGDVNDWSESRRNNAKEARSIAETDAWSDWYAVWCRDRKTRRVGTSIQPLVDGVPRNMGSLQSKLERMGVDTKRAKAMRKWAGSRLAKSRRNRVGRLKAFGAAIVPQLAAQFIMAFMATIDSHKT